jgi:hypothetical protein
MPAAFPLLLIYGFFVTLTYTSKCILAANLRQLYSNVKLRNLARKIEFVLGIGRQKKTK